MTLSEYIDGLQPGERVIETSRNAYWRCQGDVYVSNIPGPTFGSKCVLWEPLPGTTGRMGTSVTGGTRRIGEEHLVLD